MVHNVRFDQIPNFLGRAVQLEMWQRRRGWWTESLIEKVASITNELNGPMQRCALSGIGHSRNFAHFMFVQIGRRSQDHAQQWFPVKNQQLPFFRFALDKDGRIGDGSQRTFISQQINEEKEQHFTCWRWHSKFLHQFFFQLFTCLWILVGQRGIVITGPVQVPYIFIMQGCFALTGIGRIGLVGDSGGY